MIRREIQVFLTAIQLYTRIPVSRFLKYSDENLNRSTRYFPLIGLITGGISAGVFLGTHTIFSTAISLLLAITVSILITGAFHEDGLADTFDGFGGGQTPEKILEIMKDSRIGTFGAIALLAALALKFAFLMEVRIETLPLLIITAQMFSRIFPVLMIQTATYVRTDSSGKFKPVATRQSLSGLVFAIISGIGLIPLLPPSYLLIIIPGNFLFFLGFRWYVNRKIGGYTGDVLGALQQLSELVFYCAVILAQKLLI